MYLRNNKDKIFMNVRTNLTEASKREKDPVCFHEADHVDLDLDVHSERFGGGRSSLVGGNVL